jgi:protein ImuB
MPLAEALAIHASLSVHEHDAEADRAALWQLAKQAERYSPIVGLEEGPAPEGLLLDVTGCAACFGGEDRLLERAAHDLAADGWLARVAIADTIGAAWALTRYGEPGSLATGVLRSLTIPTRLAELPVAALRLPAETLDWLNRLGIDRIGALIALPRAELPARFGPLVLQRLDQALGRAPEVIVPAGAVPELRASFTLEYPTDRRAELLQVVDWLAEQVSEALRRRNLGARQLECRLEHETVAADTIDASLIRPVASPGYLSALIRDRLDRLRLAAPVCAVCLNVPRAEKLPDTQRDLFDAGVQEEAEDLAKLVDRLSNQLGRQAVARAVLVLDAQPEYACRYEPVVRFAAAKSSRSGGRASRAPPRRGQAPPLALTRPLRLLRAPVRVDAMAVVPDGPPARFCWDGVDYRVAHAWGPERIETGWWRGDDIRRDYYVVTTTAGNRFWLFRCRNQGGWFVHGCFE